MSQERLEAIESKLSRESIANPLRLLSREDLEYYTKSLAERLTARERCAELLWNESQHRARLQGLLKELHEYEYPADTFKMHPTAKGRRLWCRVRDEVRGV